VGGDFNFEPDDPEYRELERAGLRDIYAMASPETEVYTSRRSEATAGGPAGEDP
jgi:endonuclease/exonuclease/phosphatase family metal-dependent hydrolase